MADGSLDKTANRKLSTIEVDELADALVREYNNLKFRPWYCSTIYALGSDRVLEIRARVHDSDNPAMLFSKLASEAVRLKKGRERLDAIRQGAQDGR